MKEFLFANHCSINLNYVIYLNNLYENLFNPKLDRFPLLDVNLKDMVKEDEVRTFLKESWNEIISLDNLHEVDMDLWINNKYSFEKLFKDNTNGLDTYAKIKNLYESWYWGTGEYLLIKMTDGYVEEKYDILKNKFVNKDKIIMEILYDDIPEEWNRNRENYIVITPTQKFPLF